MSIQNNYKTERDLWSWIMDHNYYSS